MGVFLAMENFLAFVFTWSIIGYMVFCFIFPPKDCYEISDRFDVGYYDEPEPKQVTVKVKKEKVVNPILQDCTDALIALGVPKRKAKAEAENILKNDKITTVQEFITEYGKR